jgi:dTDP-glucose 4,6-dehydratase
MTSIIAEDVSTILRHTAGIWDELRGARVFITGGTGFFGKWLLETLVAANQRFALGMQAAVLTRRPAEFRTEARHLADDHAIHLHEGDVRTFAFPPGRFSHLIHAATPASAQLNENDPELMLDLIIQGTRRALEFARHSGVTRALFTSSGAVYGQQPSDLRHVPEEFTGAPDSLDVRSAYGVGKRVAEQLCAIAYQRHGLPVTIARGFAFVGPHLPFDAHFAVGNFLRDGLKGNKIHVSGDGTPFRSYLYAADLAGWLWTILVRGKPCRPYNVGAEEDLSIVELARKIAHYFKTEVEIAKPADPQWPVERYVPSTERARKELALKAWTDLDTALDRTARWHQGATAERVS